VKKKKKKKEKKKGLWNKVGEEFLGIKKKKG